MLINEQLVPFPIKPSLDHDSEESYTPVFCAQANMVTDGLILTVCTYSGLVNTELHNRIVDSLLTDKPIDVTGEVAYRGDWLESEIAYAARIAGWS